MPNVDLPDVYRDYISCLNQQDWDRLDQYVDDMARHNGRLLGVSGYRKMLEQDFAQIPDLYFNVQLLVAKPPYVASRLAFDCTPKGRFMGIDVNGRKVSFAENVFYEFRDGR